MFFTHPACLTVCVAWPRRQIGSPASGLKCLPQVLPHTLLHCHLHTHSPTPTPQSLTLCTHTLHPHARITGLTHHECPAAPHNLSPSHTHSHIHTLVVLLSESLGRSRPTPTPSPPPLILPLLPPLAFVPCTTCRELYCTTVCRSLGASPRWPSTPP